MFAVFTYGIQNLGVGCIFILSRTLPLHEITPFMGDHYCAMIVLCAGLALKYRMVRHPWCMR